MLLAKGIFLSLRPKQWVKNLFIFLPLVFGKKLLVFPVNLKTVGVFFAFSLAAGAAYLINDIMDASTDRLHPKKKLRPIASGMLSERSAIISACILGCLSIAISFVLNITVGFVVAGYVVFNVVYTKFLKRVVIIDVFCLGGFFLLRILAGSSIAEVQMSHWIISMTVLLALFLGFAKRRQELKGIGNGGESHRPVLAHYDLHFIDQITVVITSSIVVAYMLYTVDERTVGEFGTNHLMYSVPFVYYGIFRYLYLMYRLGEGEDPTVVLLSDSKMQVNLILWIIVCIAVIYLGL